MEAILRRVDQMEISLLEVEEDQEKHLVKPVKRTLI